MSLDSSKYPSFNTINAKNFSDYDLDYIRMQIKKNSESLEQSIEKLRLIANRRDSQLQKADNN